MQLNHLPGAVYAREVASAYYITNPRVTLIDVGLKIENGRLTDQLAVRVHVHKKPTGAVFEALSLAAPNLVIDKQKIPFPVVDIIEANYSIQRSGSPAAILPPRSAVHDPLRGGISVASQWLYGYGTLGGIVTDRLTGKKMILSNWHVLAGSEYAYPGIRILQPAYGDYGQVHHTVATLTRHAFGQGIDAAVATLNGTRAWVNDQLGIGPVTGVEAPVLGMRVVKSGRASQVTTGLIDGLEGEFPLYYGGMLRRIKHVHRIVAPDGLGEVSRAGDSGSWWLSDSSHRAVGLHFAGQNFPETGLAIAMPQVLDALNIDIALSDQPALPLPETAYHAYRLRVY